MHVVELFLPLETNAGEPIGGEPFDRIRAELLDRFGGVTFFSRSPADGLWAPDGEPPSRDRIVIVEVMVETLEPRWWQDYRRHLEREFGQEEVLVRAHEVTRL